MVDGVVAYAGICPADRSWEISVENWCGTRCRPHRHRFATKATVSTPIEQDIRGSIIITVRGPTFGGSVSLASHTAGKTALSGWPRQ
jgi:hypothetical protein